MKIQLLLAAILSLTISFSQSANNCGNYTSTGTTTTGTYPDPTPGCASNVPGTTTTGPASWDGGSCSGQIITTVTGPAVTCLTVSYEAVNTDDFATLTTNTGGVLTITGTGNCGISGNVIGPFQCGSYFYGSCQFTICSTIPFSQLILSNTGCSSGWVINCASITACTSPDINPLANFTGCDSYTLPAITGTNLTGGQAYYTGPGGTGTQYLPGTVITSSMTLYIYDAVLPCFDEEIFTITLDVTPPVINCPPALAAVCSIAEQPAYASFAQFTGAGGSASDETSLNTGSFVLLSEVSNGGTCPEIVTRTYQIADACGHTSTCSQTITIHDLVAPVFSAPPANIAVQCPTDVPAMTSLNYTDNCNPAGSVLGTDVSDGNTCPETITRTWNYTDACGNPATASQTITIQDTQAPVMSAAPANLSVQCPGDIPAMTNVNYTDNCDVPGSVPGVDGPLVGGPCGGTITRTWTYTDLCGNSASVSQVFTIDDTTPPTASNPPNITVPGGPAPAPDPLVVTDEADNCGAPTVAYVSESSDGNSCPETITRIYSVTDACGNSINVTQVIIIGDPFPPTGTAPADITVECIGDVPLADPALIIDEADNNGVPVVTHLSDVSDGNTCPETITRTYSITDICGNVTNVIQLITVIDTQSPIFAAPPANVSVQCPGDVPAMTNLSYTDNCDPAGSVAGTDGPLVGGNCGGTITRSWTYTDACGNTTTVNQTITIDDTTPPTGTAPANITVQCNGDVPPQNILDITDEADNCSVPVVAFVSDASDGNTCPEIITRTYSITDACGNSINVQQTITIDDTILPTASNPASVTVPGGPAPAPDPLVVIDEADNCPLPIVVAWVSDVSDNNPCPETIVRTYSVTDFCGNQILVTQNIIITDPIMPTGTAPGPITVECIGMVPAPDPLLITDEADNQGVPAVAFVSDVSDGNSCPETITRTYSITDICANEILVTQLITVNDITPPTASNPVGVNVECVGDVPAIDVNVVTDEADNCPLPIVVAHVSDVSDGNSCPETITRTYSVTDACGNSIDVTQTITVNDVTPPTASNPAPLNVQCIGDVPAVDVNVVTDEADNCPLPIIVAHVSDVSNGNTCPEIITRTYSVTDACGNSINVMQTISVNDNINPTASNPAPINVSCASNVPAPDPTVVTDEADNCPLPLTVAWVSDVSDGNTCNNETITRTYSVTDACGNSINVAQQIIIAAFIPSIDAGPDQSICEGDQAVLNAVNPDGAVIAWDNGITDGVSFTPAVGTITYTVSADICAGECTNTDQVNVVVNPNPTINFMGDSLQGCNPFTVTFTNQSTEQFNCVWDFGNGNQAAGCGPVFSTYNAAGLYNVTLTITSIAGCVSTDTYADYIEVIEMPVAEFSSSANLVTTENTEVEFDNTSMNAVSYDWDFGDNFGGTTNVSPTHNFPDFGEGSYEVTLVAYNSLGCPDTARELIIVEDVLLFYVPNIFTPDGDEFNEIFKPIFTSGYDIYDYHLTIFNRWGEIVFESYNSDFGWNGHYGNGGLVDDGVYIWQIKFGETGTDKKQTVRGHVTVLK